MAGTEVCNLAGVEMVSCVVVKEVYFIVLLKLRSTRKKHVASESSPAFSPSPEP